MTRCLYCHLPTKTITVLYPLQPRMEMIYFIFLFFDTKMKTRLPLSLPSPCSLSIAHSFTSRLTRLLSARRRLPLVSCRVLLFLPVHSLLKWLDVWLSSNCPGTVCRTWWWDDCCCEITNTNRHHLAFSVYSPSVRLKCTISHSILFFFSCSF